MYGVFVKCRTDDSGWIEGKDMDKVINLSKQYQSIQIVTPRWFFKNEECIPVTQMGNWVGVYVYVFKQKVNAEKFKGEISSIDEVVSSEMIDFEEISTRCFTKRASELQ